MQKTGESVTHNGKSGIEFKEYKKIVYWCKEDDIWISVETPFIPPAYVG
jgi:hypothetical protein